MPKSKRQTVVSLTKTDKKTTRESKKSTIDEVRLFQRLGLLLTDYLRCGQIQTLLDTFPYLWVFETEQMRTQYLQDVRKRWQPDRSVFLTPVVQLCLGWGWLCGCFDSIMMGKIGVMRKAVGTTAEDEYKPGCAQLSEVSPSLSILLVESSW